MEEKGVGIRITHFLDVLRKRKTYWALKDEDKYRKVGNESLSHKINNYIKINIIFTKSNDLLTSRIFYDDD